MKNPLGVLCASFALLAGTHSVFAADVEYQFTPRLGVSHLEVDRFVGINQQDSTKTTFGIGAGFGVLTPLGIVIEIGTDEFSDFDFNDQLDGFTLQQRFVDIGYQFDVGNGWRIVPRVGRSKWKLRNEEGKLFNPGPEESRNVRGYDTFAELSISRQISRVVALGGSYRYGSYQFGQNATAAVLVTLGF